MASPLLLTNQSLVGRGLTEGTRGALAAGSDSLSVAGAAQHGGGVCDSEESVFSGLEDSGSDSSEDYDEGVDGADCDKDAKRTEETSEEQAQAGPPCPRTEEVGALTRDEYEEDSSDEEVGLG
ncbi:Ribosome biogenesis protein BOP1 [Microtus ochrogaster]|uniref:Ribosome biogenesis protein BOP1 n=1 Tax=Microtus ochrogaster TaxID=79684 RepID=A0A8J6KYC7_MICOH|nr:Ribosome biogenesis protein BOP1 [Microtus ochrogaster]